MARKVPNSDRNSEHRSEQRKLVDRYYSVQFSLEKKIPIYQFKLKDISTYGLCIIIKQGSPILDKIHEDENLEMTFCAADAPHDQSRFKTKIIHITPDKRGKYKNHVLMGLAIIDDDQKPLNAPRAGLR